MRSDCHEERFEGLKNSVLFVAAVLDHVDQVFWHSTYIRKLERRLPGRPSTDADFSREYSSIAVCLSHLR